MVKRAKEKTSKSVASRHAAAAKEIASGYRFIFEPAEGIGFLGRVIELPGAMADGPTLIECAKATEFIAALMVETMLERGEQPPAGGGTRNRTEQVNLRLTPGEKAYLMEESARRGFRGLSDYIRSVVLTPN